MGVDSAGLLAVAEECVGLVRSDVGIALDWTPDSLVALDSICIQLREGGPLDGDRLDLWWKLVGSYLGEVVIRAYGGEWIDHDQADGACAVRALGITGFPFSAAARVLDGEELQSLATFARSIRAIAERQEDRGSCPSGTSHSSPARHRHDDHHD